jgi:hypothetical protein
VLITECGEIIAGHGRVAGARELGMAEVPTIELTGLSHDERRAYALADNKLALNSSWDDQLLAAELLALEELDIGVTLTGFSDSDVDKIVGLARQQTCEALNDLDVVPSSLGEPVTRQGDVWKLGRHRLICGDARDEEAYIALLGDERADLIFTDPPYNLSPAVRG